MTANPLEMDVLLHNACLCMADLRTLPDFFCTNQTTF